MEDIKYVLDLFDTKEKWISFIELSEMRDGLVKILKSRLSEEIEIIAKKELVGTGWIFKYDEKEIKIVPEGSSLIAITIYWSYWGYPWFRRGAGLWVAADYINHEKVVDKLLTNKGVLPLLDFVENSNHRWFPFVKSIPATIFDVSDDVVLMDKCLYRAKDYAKDLAESLWTNVFEPFATKEIADMFVEIVS